jgi:putative ATP-binding cassette transporter
MGLLTFLVRASAGAMVVSIVAGLLGGLCGVGLIALVHAALASRDPAAAMRGEGLAFLVVCIVSALSRLVAQATMVRLAQGTVCRLALSLCRRLLALPLRTFEGLDPAGVLAVLTEDIVIVGNALAGIPLLGINLPIVAVGLGYVGWLSPKVLAAGVGFAALAILVYQVTAARAIHALAAARAEQDRLVGHFRTLIGGFRELRLHRGRREAFFANSLVPCSATVHDRAVAGLTWFALAGSWGQVAFFGFIGVLLFGFAGDHGLGRDVLGGVVLVVLYIMTPLDVILTWLPLLGRAQVSLGRIEALNNGLAERGESVLAPGTSPQPTRLLRELIMEGVTYAYEPDEFVLGPLDLHLGRGEIVFLTGGNGAGKTTLVKLLAGLYVPAAGRVVLDGRPVTAERFESYRQLFSVVFADGHVFPSLIGLDRPDLDGEAAAVIRRLGLANRVHVEAGAFSTLDVSQGQRKRLALLAAWLEDRDIVILDEAVASQDASFKRFFYHELIPEWRQLGKTLVVITHDDQYDHLADRVLRLEAGRIRTATDTVAWSHR